MAEKKVPKPLQEKLDAADLQDFDPGDLDPDDFEEVTDDDELVEFKKDDPFGTIDEEEDEDEGTSFEVAMRTYSDEKKLEFYKIKDREGLKDDSVYWAFIHAMGIPTKAFEEAPEHITKAVKRAIQDAQLHIDRLLRESKKGLDGYSKKIKEDLVSLAEQEIKRSSLEANTTVEEALAELTTFIEEHSSDAANTYMSAREDLAEEYKNTTKKLIKEVSVWAWTIRLAVIFGFTAGAFLAGLLIAYRVPVIPHTLFGIFGL